MPADPTNEAVVLSSEQVQALGELSDIIADHLPTWLDNDYRRSLAHSIRDELLCDDYRPLLARVVAGRPDQPTQTTTVGMPVLIDGTPSDVGEWCDREYHAAPGAYCSRRVLLLDISAHTDPHTPNQGETP